MDWLRRHTETVPAPEARRILGLNPGIPADAASHWAYVGYKGGSEPGVLDMTLLLHAKSGGWYALSGTWNNPDAALAEGRLIGLMSRAATLAAERSDEHTSELQSLMRISYAVFCLKKIPTLTTVNIQI